MTTVLARPSAVLSHGTAATCWGLPVPTGLPPVVRMTDPQRWRTGPGYVMTRAELPDDEVATRVRHRLSRPGDHCAGS